MSVGPFWKYYGAKWRAAPRYPAPECSRIVEHFAGAAGYACRYPHHEVVLIDVDPIIAGIWAYLIKATPAEILALPDIPEGGTTDDLPVCQEARWLAGFWCNNGVAEPAKSPSKWVRESSGRKLIGWCQAIRERIAAGVPRIKHWQIIHGSYTDAPSGEATHFVDPPYQTAAGRRYRHSDVDYQALGAHCLALEGQVIAMDQVGADWLPWTGKMDHKSTLGWSKEVVYHRSNQLSLFGGDS